MGALNWSPIFRIFLSNMKNFGIWNGVNNFHLASIQWTMIRKANIFSTTILYFRCKWFGTYSVNVKYGTYKCKMIQIYFMPCNTKCLSLSLYIYDFIWLYKKCKYIKNVIFT